MVKVTGTCPVAVFVTEADTLTVGNGVGTTLTDVETGWLFPAVSVKVAFTRYVPAFANTCWTELVPLMAPRLCVSELSPQSIVTFCTASPAGRVPTTTENAAGKPSFAVVGGVMVSGITVGFTTTPVDTDTTVPKLSVSVPVIV